MSELINGFTGFARKESLGAFQYARDTDRPRGDGTASFDPDKLRLIPATDRRWAWTEIDLNAIRHNATAVKQRIGRACGLPVAFEAGLESVLEALPERWPRLPIRRYLTPEWMKWNE